MRRASRAFIRVVHIMVVALFAPVVVVVAAVHSAKRDRMARKRSLEPGTLTEVSFTGSHVADVSQSPSGGLRIRIDGPVRLTRMSPSGVAEAVEEAFAADLPFAPELLVALSFLQSSGIEIDGQMRFFSRPDSRIRSSEVLQMLRIVPIGQPEAGLEMTLE